MSCYVIGIGGSGARCVEALLHLCAAGLGPDELTVVFVDPDRSNGNLERALRLANWYADLQAIRKGESCPFLRTSVSLTKPEVWTPFGDGQATPSLDKFFEYNTLRNAAPPVADLFETLYSSEQRTATLNIGFRGRPSIGAAVFGARIDVATEEPWCGLASRVRNEASNGQLSRIFAFGSIFGGTGAAGLPTIPRLILAGEGVRRDHVALGSALLLPYFSFVPDAGEKELYASPQGFLLNAKEALRYYSMCNPDYNRMYVLGADQLSSQPKFSIGGNTQKNSAGLVEFLAALASLDFFTNAEPSESRSAMIGRRDREAFTWDDVPNGQIVQRQLAQYARMSIAYVTMFYPRLRSIWESGTAAALRTPWYVDRLVKTGVDIADRNVQNSLGIERSLHSSFLAWLREMHNAGTGNGGLNLRLADVAALPDSETADGPPPMAAFRNVLLQGRQRENSPDDIWKLMCERPAGRGPAGVDGLGGFQRRLHEVCQ